MLDQAMVAWENVYPYVIPFGYIDADNYGHHPKRNVTFKSGCNNRKSTFFSCGPLACD
jgi:muramidase (phage lysozyme)